jgi:hypothetical protein
MVEKPSQLRCSAAFALPKDFESECKLLICICSKTLMPTDVG